MSRFPPLDDNGSQFPPPVPSGGGVSDGDKGDITVTGSGATWTIDAGVVTLAKMANIATDRLLGRDTAASGVPEELTVGGGIEFTGSGGVQTSAFTGDVTKTAGGTALTIAADAVTYAKIQNVADNRVLGRAAGSSGDVTELTVGAPLTIGSGALDFDEAAALGNVARTTIRKNTGADVGSRRRLNLIEGSNITLTVTDDSGSEEVDITIAASGGGSSITRINGSSGAAGADITCQKLSANATTNSTTTLATVMTTTAVGAGTWQFKYSVIYQAAATSTGVDFAVNHTGTVTKMVASSWFVTTGGAAANGLADQIGSNTASLAEGKAARAINTKFGSSLGVDTANANMQMIIEGTIVVSATGSLELKHASEVAAASTVQAETNLILTKIG